MNTPPREGEPARGGLDPRRLPHAVWAPLAAGALMLLAGGLGLIVGQPWLFPSLGPTAFLQVETPDQPASRFYNTVVGHAVGIVAGFLAVLALRAGQAPPLFATHQLVPVRVWASVLAIVLSMLGIALLRATHPPAAATTLLISLGGFRPTAHDALTIAAGVLIVAVAGEALRRFRLEPAPRSAVPTS